MDWGKECHRGTAKRHTRDQDCQEHLREHENHQNHHGGDPPVVTLQVLVLLELLLAVLYSPLYGALQSLGDIFCPNPF